MRNLYIITDLSNKRKIKKYLNRELKKSYMKSGNVIIYFYYRGNSKGLLLKASYVVVKIKVIKIIYNSYLRSLYFKTFNNYSTIDLKRYNIIKI